MDHPHTASTGFVRSVLDQQIAVDDQQPSDWPRYPLLILSERRAVRETLCDVLKQAFRSADFHNAASVEEAVAKIDPIQPALVLIDISLHGGLAAVRRLRQHDQTTRLVAFNVDCVIRDIAAWSRAGVVAHVGRSPVLNEIVENIADLLANQATRERSLAEHAGNVGKTKGRSGAPINGIPAPLTTREKQVARMIAGGDTNKEIARALDISVATVKSHVHNLLRKLGLPGRGKLALWYDGRLSSPDVTHRNPPGRSEGPVPA